MHLVDIKEINDERTSRGRAPALIEPQAPKANDVNSATPIPVRAGRHLDVDEILARSVPNLGAFSDTDVKTIVLR